MCVRVVWRIKKWQACLQNEKRDKNSLNLNRSVSCAETRRRKKKDPFSSAACESLSTQRSKLEGSFQFARTRDRDFAIASEKMVHQSRAFAFNIARKCMYTSVSASAATTIAILTRRSRLRFSSSFFAYYSFASETHAGVGETRTFLGRIVLTLSENFRVHKKFT